MKGGPGVALIRVDNRLVHGQVLEAWLPALDAHGVLIADDEAAGNVLARSAMALAIPPKVQFQVLRVSAAAELLRPGGTGVPGVRTLLLVRDVRDASALAEQGVPIPRLNLGNVHFANGRRQVAPSVYLDAGEMEALSRLASRGTEVEARAVPSEHPTPLSTLQTRFASAHG
ncbi:MAG: PTS sugar transporter subunit IIB [Deltaproteobacteria bacterium]|nr:MAG: PTS sugar transporter subunit IIB [Deltaproteobacteria bacterium]